MRQRRAARRRGERSPVPGQYPVRFGQAELLRDLDRPNGWLLNVNGVAQSYVDLDDPTHLEFDYVRRIGDVVDCVAEQGHPLDVVHIGGGACTLPRYIAATRPGSRQLVLEADGPLVELVRLGKLRWRIEQDYRELKGALGLDHFEGRSWPGWHHHVSLVSVAHGFLTLERLGRPKQVASA